MKKVVLLLSFFLSVLTLSSLAASKSVSALTNSLKDDKVSLINFRSIAKSSKNSDRSTSGNDISSDEINIPDITSEEIEYPTVLGEHISDHSQKQLVSSLVVAWILILLSIGLIFSVVHSFITGSDTREGVNNRYSNYKKHKKRFHKL